MIGNCFVILILKLIMNELICHADSVPITSTTSGRRRRM